jgi:hypothetical protein
LWYRRHSAVIALDHMCCDFCDFREEMGVPHPGRVEEARFDPHVRTNGAELASATVGGLTATGLLAGRVPAVHRERDPDHPAEVRQLGRTMRRARPQIAARHDVLIANVAILTV